MNVQLDNLQTSPLYLDRFTALRHTQFLSTLARLRFSGQLTLTDPVGQQWTFYIDHGLLVYATGGEHQVRRWRRNLVVYCPQIPIHLVVWKHDLKNVDVETLDAGWEYALLCLWVKQKRITRRQAIKIVGSSITEVLFDVAQATEITYQINEGVVPPKPLVKIEISKAVAFAQQRFQSWQNAMLSEYSPNGAPVIRDLERIKSRRSAQSFKAMFKLLDGRRTLRDLAVQTRQSDLDLGVSLLPGLQLGWVELTNAPDLRTPIHHQKPSEPSPLWPKQSKELIACVDDSLMIRQTMEEFLTAAGYQFVGVGDPLRALGVLMARKPNLIFLDLVMPNVNGYEVCQQLRKLSIFREIPIVILTGNDGFTSRLRSNFVGASDFLSKPLNAESLLGVIQKHLDQGVPSY